MNRAAKYSRFSRLAGKELKETLRDRRTLITLFLMPILLYPLLSLIMNRLILSSGLSNAPKAYRLGVVRESDGRILLDAIQVGQLSANSEFSQPLKIAWSKPTGSSNVEIPLDPLTSTEGTVKSDSNPSDSKSSSKQETPDSSPGNQYSLMLVEDGDVEKALDQGTIDIAVEIIEQKRIQGVDYLPANISILFREDDPISENAVLELRKLFSYINEIAAYQQRVQLGVADAIPIRMLAKPSAKASHKSSGLAGIIPLILILMTITGGVYPAIDLTAGERERGTLEALIASPISRFQLVASKYVAVVSVSILTALINLLAMAATLKLTGVGDAVMGQSGMDWRLLMRALPLLVVFAAFFSSVLVALCSFARSFKEAQAYLIPIMLLSLGPGIISLMPTVKLTHGLAVLPQINLILLARDTLGRVDTSLSIMATVLVTTAFYTLAALVLASKGFGDQVAVAGDDFRWSDLFRRPDQSSDYPTLGQLATYLAFFFPLYFAITSWLSTRGNVSMQANAVLNSIVLFALFLMLPWLYASLIRVRMRTTFRLQLGHMPLLASMVAICFAATLWMFAVEILYFSDLIGFKTLSDEVLEKTTELRKQFLNLPWWLVMLTMAVAPAICEEFFFRGFVLSSLLSHVRQNRAVFLSAGLFGLFHVVYGSLLSVERFLPTMLLGIFLGYLAIYSKSLLPGILLHAGHNGLLFSLPYFDEKLKAWGFDRENGQLPWTWLAVSTVVALLAFLVLRFQSQRSLGVDGRNQNGEVQNESERPKTEEFDTSDVSVRE